MAVIGRDVSVVAGSVLIPGIEKLIKAAESRSDLRILCHRQEVIC